MRSIIRAGLCIAALATALTGTGLNAPAQAATAPVPEEAADEATARGLASRTGKRIEVLDRRTETTRVFATPSGALGVEQYAVPQRVRRADGGWTAPDPTLRRDPDGSVTPVAIAVGLRLSGGGNGPLVTASRGDKSFSLSWPGSLPVPVLAGDTATYAEVLPGVDLVVRAEVGGFSEVLVVKSRQAAQNPALAKLTFGTKLSGLKLKDDGDTLRIVEEDGDLVFGSGTAMMWDSAAARNAAAAPDAGARRARMPVSVGKGSMEVTPDRAMLADTGTRYPVYIDPGASITSWTMINKAYPGQSYWSYDKGSGAKVGYADPPVDPSYSTYRSLFEFPTGAWRGSNIHITKAIFSITLKHSWMCHNTPTELRVSSQKLGPGTTWNSNAGSWGSAIASAWNQNCRDVAGVRTEFAGYLRDTVQASTGWNMLTLGLSAANEGNHDGWKKFDPATAHLYVELNHYPNTPTGLSTNGKPCGTGRVYIGTGDGPTLRSTVSDPDLGTLTGTYEWWEANADGTPTTTRLNGGEQGGVGSGNTAQLTLTTGVLRTDDTVVATGDWDTDGHPDVLARRANGLLFLHPGGEPKLQSGIEIGSGWGGFTVAGVADFDGDEKLDIVARANDNGDLYLYPGEGKRGYSTKEREKIGTGWIGLSFAGVADFDGDEKPDILARDDTNGDLRLYRGDGMGGFIQEGQYGWRKIGTGWSNGIFVGVLDWDRDGNNDILVQTPWNGDLRLYLGDGKGGFIDEGPNGWLRIGSGWTDQYSAVAIPDWNDDGKADLVAKQRGVRDVLLYPGGGSRTEWGGPRWSIGQYGDFANNGVYVWRAGSRDPGGLWSNVTGWCAFEVDIVRPDKPPTVSSADYPDDGAGHGKVGQDGTAKLGANGVADVIGYKYGPDSETAQYAAADGLGGGASVTMTPLREGLNNLFVRSVDRAGNVSALRTYTYLAGSQYTRPVAHWRMEDKGGGTLADATGNGHTATLGGNATVGDGVASFNGSTGYASTSGPVVDTGKSFSVAAWVRLTDTNDWRGVVAQDGASGSGFFLQYLKGDRWAFCRGPDSATESGTCVRATDPPALGAWAHIMGVYDAGQQQLRLFVNGKLQGTAAFTAPWTANGPLQIGRYKYGNHRSHFAGDIDDVRVWNRVATDYDLQYILRSGYLANPALRWDLDEGSGFTTADGSVHGRDGTLLDGAAWGPGSGDDPGLALDGKAGYAASTGPATRTDQSFTVAAWVKLDSTATWATAVSQEGARASGMLLQFDKDHGTWAFATQNADADGVGAARVWSTSAPHPGVWTHLAGTYDAAAGQLKIYVNGDLEASADARITWNATGRLLAGAEKYNGTLRTFWPGGIDDLKVFPGMLSDQDVRELARS